MRFMHRAISVSSFFSEFDTTRFILLVISIVSSLICITVHELSHGFAAYRLGDPTAKERGRLTLNPIAHIDIFGLVMMVVARVGWAKPVPVDMRNFQNPKRDMALTALAGPASNFILAFLAVALAKLSVLLFVDLPYSIYLILFFCTLAVTSAGLGIFNLIPVPPLDGSKILFSFLPERIYYFILRYERVVMTLVFLLVWSDALDKPLSFLIQSVIHVFCNITTFPFGFFEYFFF